MKKLLCLSVALALMLIMGTAIADTKKKTAFQKDSGVTLTAAQEKMPDSTLTAIVNLHPTKDFAAPAAYDQKAVSVPMTAATKSEVAPLRSTKTCAANSPSPALVVNDSEKEDSSRIYIAQSILSDHHKTSEPKRVCDGFSRIADAGLTHTFQTNTAKLFSG